MSSDVFDHALRARLERAHDTLVEALRRERDPTAGWPGELSASALSTATAVTALRLVDRAEGKVTPARSELIRRGYAWLVQNQNADGGWGDTTRSFSNISTTTLVWAAFGVCDHVNSVTGLAAAGTAAEQWLRRVAGSTEPARLVAAIERRYGKDRTFSIPILTLCALCGRLGPGRDGWRHVRQLPFELAILPQAWFGALRLPVVSYALPALIAIGQVRHGLRPTRNPVMRGLRALCRQRTLRKLETIQPGNGGFLEATPLTSFVTMSLAALGLSAHPVTTRGVAFLEASARADGSWPIDTNLTTWLTTLSVNALIDDDENLEGAASSAPGARSGADEAAPSDDVNRQGEDGRFTSAERRCVIDWLIRQQYREIHPYTLAAPGGWSWTDLPGGVPDADDTAGAILALCRLGPSDAEVPAAVAAGTRWLLDLQNRDGGIPTFCRGWGWLPFDRSSPDITAHVVRAWTAACHHLPDTLRRHVASARRRACDFLLRSQGTDGTWSPLWFGHQQHPTEENPLYGTARVMLAFATLPNGVPEAALVREAAKRGLEWLIWQQNVDGGWSGAPGAPSSMEETGLALEALAEIWTRSDPTNRSDALGRALRRGGDWLIAAIEDQRWLSPTPIGFYFAKLWYFERLYPLIFSTSALVRMTKF